MSLNYRWKIRSCCLAIECVSVFWAKFITRFGLIVSLYHLRLTYPWQVTSLSKPPFMVEWSAHCKETRPSISRITSSWVRLFIWFCSCLKLKYCRRPPQSERFRASWCWTQRWRLSFGRYSSFGLIKWHSCVWWRLMNLLLHFRRFHVLGVRPPPLHTSSFPTWQRWLWRPVEVPTTNGI